jgi:hypothetical protein
MCPGRVDLADLEVTPEMIRAGGAELRKWYGEDGEAIEHSEDAAEVVFRAMVALAAAERHDEQPR